MTSRTARPTQRQLEALVDFLERNPEIARGLLRTQQGKLESRRKWAEFATVANALGGVLKDGPAWAKSQPSPSIDEPSTSSADNAEPMIVIITAEDEVLDPPQSPSVEASQQVEATPQVETRHTATRRAHAPRQNCRSRSVSFLETELRRFEEIESKRVEAEMLHAQALAQIAAAFTELVSLVGVHLERDRRDQPPLIKFSYYIAVPRCYTRINLNAFNITT